MKADQTLPSGRWVFDASVTEVFDNMLERSIPNYEEMRRQVFAVGSRHVLPNTHIVDMGCSRGGALAAFVEAFGTYNRYMGIEVSEPMLEAARRRFGGMMDAGMLTLESIDLRESFPDVDASLILCVLTLQFTPIEYRQQILARVASQLTDGGAFILVEKVLGNSAEIDDMMVDIYYELKRENGYSNEQIERKRLSLEGALVPMTAAFNEQLLEQAGFKKVDCFWRWQNFAAWVAIK